LSEDRLLSQISTRFTFQQIKDIEAECGKHKKFTDRSAGIRYYFERGRQFESLLEIYNNPEKKKEFEGKMVSIAKEKDIEKIAETMTINEIKAAKFVLVNIENKKIQQLILDVKSR